MNKEKQTKEPKRISQKNAIREFDFFGFKRGITIFSLFSDSEKN